MSPLAKRTLELAVKNLGQKERTGRNDGSFVEKLQDWADKKLDGIIQAYYKNAPWCVMHCVKMIHDAAKELGMVSQISERASTSRLHKELKAKNLLLRKPVDGCIGMVKGGKTGFSHTFLVEKVDLEKGVVHGLDGNISNRVRRTVRAISLCEYGQIV